MANDTEALMRLILGMSADLTSIKEALCRANLTTPDELQKLADLSLQQILDRPDVKEGLAAARWSDVLDGLGKT